MYGKLGHGNELGHPAPCRVEALVGHKVEQIACGSRHTAALLSGGEVYAWGDRENGVCGVGEVSDHQYAPRCVEGLKGKKLKQISACGFHTAAISDNGEMWYVPPTHPPTHPPTQSSTHQPTYPPNKTVRPIRPPSYSIIHPPTHLPTKTGPGEKESLGGWGMGARGTTASLDTSKR